jgi:S-adenosylmethionine decarboxylase
LKNPFNLQSTSVSTQTPGAIPGLHIVANFAVDQPEKLKDFTFFKNFIDQQIETNELCMVGEVYHNFDNGGYTGVVCLTESHLSIHTWPENNYLTFDIFLSNYLKDNTATTRKLYEQVKAYFEARVLFEQIIHR